MPRPYSAEFRRRALALVEAGRSVSKTAADLDVTEATLYNWIKRVKRRAFGFRRFKNYRIRALLYAGKPDWSLLGMVGPP